MSPDYQVCLIWGNSPPRREHQGDDGRVFSKTVLDGGQTVYLVSASRDVFTHMSTCVVCSCSVRCGRRNNSLFCTIPAEFLQDSFTTENTLLRDRFCSWGTVSVPGGLFLLLRDCFCSWGTVSVPEGLFLLLGTLVYWVFKWSPVRRNTGACIKSFRRSHCLRSEIENADPTVIDFDPVLIHFDFMIQTGISMSISSDQLPMFS